MKEKEIEQMQAGYDLDALIYAEVFGKMAFRAEGRWEFTNERDYLDKGEAYYLGEHQEIIRLPRYSTDMSAAYTVIEKLHEMGAWISISILPNYKTWDVRGILNERESNEIRFINHDESLPLAICRAALLARQLELV